MASLEDTKAAQRVIGATADGNFGARSVDALVAWLRDRGYLAPPAIASDARARVVALALSQEGPKTEAQIDALWREVGVPEFVGHWHDKAWCGAFALRVYQVALGVSWPWLTGPKVYGFAESHLTHTNLPEPGDLAYFAKNQHHAIVVGVGAGKVELVNGNGMTAPTEGVTRTTRPLGDAAYYSIARVLP